MSEVAFESITLPLPASSSDVTFVRWLFLSVAALFVLLAAGLAFKWVAGIGGLGNWELPLLLLFTCSALLFLALEFVVFVPNPEAITVDVPGLTWHERSGRTWRIDWSSVPVAPSMGYSEFPFGSGTSSIPTVAYWLVYRRVRNIVITQEAFEAIRTGAHARGLRETETHPLATQPTTTLVRIRWGQEPSPR